MAFRAQNIGVMRERITLNSITTVKESDGFLTVTSVPVATVWSKVDFETAGRQTQGGQIVENQPYNIIIRYRNDLDPSQSNQLTKQYTVTWNNTELTIHSIKFIDIKRRFIEIKAYGQD